MNAQARESEAGVEAVWRRRAAELAARRAPERRAAGTPVLTFLLGGERYAFALTDLHGVLPFGRCTPVPGAPPELAGLINQRGRICSVLDLARLLGLPGGPGAGGYILLLRAPGREIGLRVDRVEAIRVVLPDELLGGETVPAEGTARLATGLTRDGLVLLDRAALLGLPVFRAEGNS